MNTSLVKRGNKHSHEKPLSLMSWVGDPDELGKERTKIFQILDNLAKKPLLTSFDRYLEGAMNLLSHAEKSFIEFRSEKLLVWLIENLCAQDTQTHSTENKCHIHSLIHTVDFPFISKKVLSLCIDMQGVHLDFESVQKSLLLKYQGTAIVDGSIVYVINQREGISKIHLELQRETVFLDQEIANLKMDLYRLIQKYSEKRHAQLIIPSNKELLMKSFHWIMNDINRNDPPHVFIDFSHQVANHFQFSVLVCHILSSKEKSLGKRLIHGDIHIDAMSSYKEGFLTKEGIILTLDIPSTPSLSVLDARIQCSNLIKTLIGPFRDVNGGLLEKVEKNFSRLSKEINAPIDELKDFFYGIVPQEKQATAPLSLLKKVYYSLQEQKLRQKELDYEVVEDDEMIVITMKAAQSTFEKEYRRFLMIHCSHLLITSASVDHAVVVCCGALKQGAVDAEVLKNLTIGFYSRWLEKKEVKQVLKLACAVDFTSLDPRIGCQEDPSYLLKMLFEGLMRIGPDGNPQNAIARQIDISESGLLYRFHLRKSTWPNGLPLTAHDFAYSWRTSLKPTFKSPLSYLFFPIENAKAIKNGTLPTTKLGVRVIDDYTFEVKLQYPSPYFLELCAHSTFSPICQEIDSNNPSWPKAKGKEYVCNGPFTLDHTSTAKEIVLSRNPFYWRTCDVHLEKVIISKVTEKEAQSLFEKKKIDLALYPFCKDQSLNKTNRTHVARQKGVIDNRYLSFNCLKPPFSNKKLRQAFSLALQRDKLASYFSDDASPLYTPYSPAFSQLNLKKSTEENIEQARNLFNEALQEMKCTKNIFDKEEIYTIQNIETFAHQLVHQLNSTFDLNMQVVVLNSNSKLSFLILEEKINLFICSWINRIKDPGYFLGIFSSNDMTHYARWENTQINEWLESIFQSSHIEDRKVLHKKAEELLHEECPLLPLISAPIYSVIPSKIKNVITTNSHQFDICFSHKI